MLFFECNPFCYNIEHKVSKCFIIIERQIKIIKFSHFKEQRVNNCSKLPIQLHVLLRKHSVL